MGKNEQVNITSLKLVRDELVATIEQAAAKLEQYVANRSNAEMLQGTIDAIGQIAGIFKLVQLHGADLLAAEILAAAKAINIEEGASNDEILSELTSAFFILPRYLEYVQQTKRGLPVLLLDYVNELRRVRKLPLISEDYFFEIDTGNQYRPTRRLSTLSEVEFGSLIRRLRHMYQVGLLSLLQDKQPRSALGIMQRALERVEAVSGSEPLAKLWWVATGALEAIIGDKMELNKQRKMLFSVIDRHLKQLQNGGLEVLATAPSDALLKRFVFIVALSNSNTERMEAVLRVHNAEALGYSDADLRSEREALRGPSANTVSSVAAVLQDEIRVAKEILEAAGQMSESGGFNDSGDLIETLRKTSEILAVVGLSSAANSLKEEVAKLEQRRDDEQVVSSDQLIGVADVLLYVESSVNNLGQLNLSDDSLNKANKTARAEVIASAQLAEAELVVIQEAEAGLALIKRALSSFVESDFDRGHVRNVAATLDSVRGGMFVLQLTRATRVLASCSEFIQEALVKSNSQVAMQQLLETFADAIIALEYYLDAYKYDKNTDESVLSLAEESLEALGYRVES